MIREKLRSPDIPSLSKQLVIFTGPTASGKEVERLYEYDRRQVEIITYEPCFYRQ